MAFPSKHVWHTYVSNERVLYSWTFAVISAINMILEYASRLIVACAIDNAVDDVETANYSVAV